jgi:hypothetical protein
LIWFGRSYIAQLVNAIPLAIYVFYTPRLISSVYYYPLLIFLLTLTEFIKTFQSAAHVGFFASISDPHIGGTYMTFLATLANLGAVLNSSIVLYAANWLPKKYDYLIAVLICDLLGIIWLSLSYQTLRRLQKLPTSKWYVTKQVINTDIITSKEQHHNEQEISFIQEKEKD